MLASTSLTDKMLENLYESLLAGIYLDGGLKEAKKFVMATLDFKSLNKQSNALRSNDYKSALYEYCAKRKFTRPEFVFVGKSGSDHNPTHTVNVLVDGKVLADGQGKTKKEAEQNASQKAIKILKNGKK